MREANNLDRRQETLIQYKNNLKTNYESLLKLSSQQLLSELENAKNNNINLEDSEDDVEILINPNNDNLNEVIVLNLFFVNDLALNGNNIKKATEVKINEIKFEHNAITNKDKQCSVYFGIIYKLKNYFCVGENSLLIKNKNIIEMIESQDDSEIKIDDF